MVKDENKRIMVTIRKCDYDLLKYYGFDFSKNFQNMCYNVCCEIMECIKKEGKKNSDSEE